MPSIVNDPSQNWLYRLGQNVRNYGAEVPPFSPILSPIQTGKNIWSSIKGFGSGALRAERNFRTSLGTSGGAFNEGLLRNLAQAKAGFVGEPLPDWANPPTTGAAVQPNKFTPSAARASAIGESARSRVTGLTPEGKINITTPLGSYSGVSPEFARTAGAITPEQENAAVNVLSASRNKTAQDAQAKITQNIIDQNKEYNNALVQFRSTPNAQATPVGMSNNEKMERYGTLFPDQLPQNPTLRDVQNLRDYSIRSRLVPTSNTNSGAAAGAAASQNNF